MTSLARLRETALRLPPLLAVQDAVALGYLAVIGLLVWRADGPARIGCLARIAASALAVVLAAIGLRWLSAIPAQPRRHAYRLALAAVVLEGYLMLRELLPLVRRDHLDELLLAVDTAVFGVTPSLWLERWCNGRIVIEWFSLCYFSYFFLCGGYIVAVLWLVRPGLRTAFFAIGSMLCMFGGHLGYLAVPGYGPIVHLAGSFERPIDGGFFWGCVSATVQMGGAMKDIFPSLHTALPTWFTLFAWQLGQSDRRWRAVGIATGLLAANIIVSTVVLRWHYAVDVAAGLLLAFGASRAAWWLALAEERWRARRALPGPWDAPE